MPTSARYSEPPLEGQVHTKLCLKHILLFCALLLATLLSACNSPTPQPQTPTPTHVPFYTLLGGGSCVQRNNHLQPPYANIQVSHDTYRAHSEPMLVEDPHNPLHLVGGFKFFTDRAHYRFQIGTYASFDGGCTWRDGGVLPGFAKNVTTSDISFAFGTHNQVYAAVLTTSGKVSGISVSTSTDGGKTFGRLELRSQWRLWQRQRLQ